ncbi:MAG TPA: ABC transporter permease [Clostridia bacterium]|nr:ABC transporter permease [Clostridia bacterium]
MKTIIIIAKEFKQNIRNFKANIMMILFPIVLIAILGAAFSGVFSNTIDLGDVKVLYTDKITQDKHFKAVFSDFRKSISIEPGVQFEETADETTGKAGIQNSAYSAYLIITENPLKFELYKNDRRGFDATLVETALNSFIMNYDSVAAIAMVDSSALEKPEIKDFENPVNYVQTRSLDKKRQPGSLDYYAVTMLTLILLYSSLTGFWAIRSEMEQKTAARMLCAPIRGYQLLTGKVIGCISVTAVQGLVVILFSKLVLKAYWGENILPVALLLLTYSIMTVSLGVASAYVFKSSDTASGLLNSIIPLLVFLGGGYVPLSVMGGFISKITFLSPVNWVNTALFKIIYDHDYSGMPVSIILNLSLSALFIFTSALISGKGKRLYA